MITESQADLRRREEARHWLLLMTSPDQQQLDMADFDRWRAGDPLNERAFREVERTWNLLGALGTSAAEVEAGLPVLPQRQQHVSPRKWPLALAACVALMALGIAMVLSPPGSARILLADARTNAGETRTLTLADGTQVQLNGASAISYDFDADSRVVELVEGEAYFDIAGDPRPFTVRAGNARIRDIGTRFNVRRTGERGSVTVEEGVVAISIAPQADETVVKASGQIAWDESVLRPATSVPVGEALAWQRGRMVFRSRPAGEVLEELARYRPGRIFVWNEAIRQHPVTGVFNTADPDAVLEAVVQTLPARKAALSPYLTILY